MNKIKILWVLFWINQIKFDILSMTITAKASHKNQFYSHFHSNNTKKNQFRIFFNTSFSGCFNQDGSVQVSRVLKYLNTVYKSDCSTLEFLSEKI